MATTAEHRPEVRRRQASTSILGVATPTARRVVKAITTTPDRVHGRHRPGRRRPRARTPRPRRPTSPASATCCRCSRILDLIKKFRARRQDRRHALQRRRVQLGLPRAQAEKAAASDGPHDRRRRTASNSAEVQAAAQSLVGRVRRHLGDHRQHRRLGAGERRQGCEQNKIPLIAGDTDSVKRGAVAAYAFDY